MTHSASEVIDHLGALVEELGEVSNCVRTLYSPHPARQAWAECESGAELASVLYTIRHARDEVFDPAARDECAWDMILDLARSELVGATVTVSNLCAATNKPQTSALRKLNNLVKAGLVTKRPDLEIAGGCLSNLPKGPGFRWSASTDRQSAGSPRCRRLDASSPQTHRRRTDGVAGHPGEDFR